MSRRIYTIEEYDEMLPEAIEELKEALLLENGKIVTGGKKEFIEGDKSPTTLKEQVERIIGSYLFQYDAKNRGYETIEEFEDFDIDDEPKNILDIPTGIEVKDLIEESPPDIKKDVVPAEEPAEGTTESPEPVVEEGK